jgi:hypothetical protein
MSHPTAPQLQLVRGRLLGRCGLGRRLCLHSGPNHLPSTTQLSRSYTPRATRERPRLRLPPRALLLATQGTAAPATPSRLVTLRAGSIFQPRSGLSGSVERAAQDAYAPASHSAAQRRPHAAAFSPTAWPWGSGVHAARGKRLTDDLRSLNLHVMLATGRDVITDAARVDEGFGQSKTCTRHSAAATR